MESKNLSLFIASILDVKYLVAAHTNIKAIRIVLDDISKDFDHLDDKDFVANYRDAEFFLRKYYDTRANRIDVISIMKKCKSSRLLFSDIDIK